MAKAILMQVGKGNETHQLLVETDDTVTVPIITITPTPSDRRIPEGAEEVVSIADFKANLDSVKDTIVSCCQVLQETMKAVAPEKFAVEFGIKLSGEAGIPMLTKSSVEGNFKVTVEWHKDK